MKQSSKPYIESTKDFKKFKDLLIVNFNNININNTHYIESLFNNISSVKIKGKVHFIKECSRFFKVLRNGKGVSKLSSSYWVSMGWSTSDAKEKALGLQRGRSHLTIEYWLNKGYTKNAAINKISEIQQKNSRNRYSKHTCDEIVSQSVWSKSHWLSKGYTEKEAQYEIDKRNYAKRAFWKTDEEYNEIRKIIGKKTKSFIKNNPEKYSSFFGSISKEEIKFFDFLLDEPSLGIIHKEFIVNVKSSNELNKGIVKYDGYIKTDDGIILIEYDGLYWHNQSYDEIKDRITLELRNDILGIIRVSCETFKRNKSKIIDLVYESIENIKSKKSNRIKLY